MRLRLSHRYNRTYNGTEFRYTNIENPSVAVNQTDVEHCDRKYRRQLFQAAVMDFVIVQVGGKRRREEREDEEEEEEEEEGDATRMLESLSCVYNACVYNARARVCVCVCDFTVHHCTNTCSFLSSFFPPSPSFI
jgi:hypothetical protein